MPTQSPAEYLEPLFTPASPGMADARPTGLVHGEVRVPGLHEGIQWTLEVPTEHLAYDGLVLLIPGYGCVKRYSRGERHANAQAGEATISYNPARVSGSFTENLLHSQELHTKTAAAVLTDVQRQFIGRSDVPNSKHINPHRVTLSAHSMGGYPAAKLSLQRSNDIEALIFKAATGFGAPSWRLLWNLDLPATAAEILDYALSGEVEVTPKNMLRIARYYGRSPSRTLGEGAACLTAALHDDMAKVAAHGIPTAYLGFEKDGLVPVKHAGPVARRLVDMFEVMPGMGHLAPQRYPLETSAAVRGLRRRLSGY